MEMDIFNAVDGYIGGLFVKEDLALTAALKDMREAGLAGDQRFARAREIPPHAGKAQGRAPHSRNRHARRL